MTTKSNSTGRSITAQEQQRRQLRMGPAPFASFEDLSDEVESPEDKQAHLIRLPGIHEDVVTTPSVHDELASILSDNEPQSSGIISLIGGAGPAGSSSMLVGSKLTAPCTPRIDISRASSSSHHEDSKDSTPENQDAITALGVGFREEGALELRSSTEELDFQTTNATGMQQHKSKSRPTSPLVFICDPNFDRQRKDSQTSEICLLSISGRTSRLSSVGSQCSDHSRISTASHLSVMSGQSGISGRSTSPHKMLLETSFCGSRANLTDLSTSNQTEASAKDDSDVLEKVLLARKHDPREAILGEGITIETKRPIETNKPSKKSVVKPARVSKENIQAPPLTIPTISIADSNQTAYESKYVSSKGDPLIPGQTIKTQTGTEFTFIPLKGPLPKDFNATKAPPTQRKRSTSTSGAPGVSTGRKSTNTLGVKSKSTLGASGREPEYIRIKLKPDHMYKDGDSEVTEKAPAEKPKTLNLAHKQLNKIQSVQSSASSSVPPSATPLSRKSSTISPATPTPTPPGGKQRKSVFTTNIAEPRRNSRSRSKSRERNEWSPAATMSSTESIDAGGGRKQKTSVFSIFKPKKTPTKSSTKSSAENLSQYESGITNVEFTFDTPGGIKSKRYHEQLLEGDSIRIPLHSPSEYENRTILAAEVIRSETKEDDHLLNGGEENANTSCVIIETKQKSISTTNSEDSSSAAAVTVIETTSERRRSLKQYTTSSTSSENVVFTTKIGSNEEIFTTKLPKKLSKETSPGDLQNTTKLESNEEAKLPKKEKETSTVDQLQKTTMLSGHEKKLSKETTPGELDNKEELLAPKLPKTVSKEPTSGDLDSNAEILSTKIPKKLSREASPGQQMQKNTNLSSSEELATKKIPKKLRKETTSSDSKDTTSIIIQDKAKTPPKTPSDEITKSDKKEAVKTSEATSDVDVSNRNSIISTTGNEETSENSENDSEIEFINKKTSSTVKKDTDQVNIVEDHERKTLVFQTDSFDDELPYVPTTLPLERSVAMPIVPVKQRATFEMKTRPIERPRSTTPINPSTIDDYCGENTLSRRKNAEKLRISLPRGGGDDKADSTVKSPRKGTTNPKAWQEFAEKAIVSTASHQSTPSSGGSSHYAADSGDEVPPPPLPPRSAPKEQTKQWINFEEIPEKHKPPKRIQTIPSRSHIDVVPPAESMPSSAGAETAVIYNYVNPEDCQCECHEAAAAATNIVLKPSEEIEPLLSQDDDSSDETMKQCSTSSTKSHKMMSKR